VKKRSKDNSRFKIQDSRSGFTLLELVIAVTILSLITIIIGSSFRLGIHAWEKGDKETGEIQRLRILSGLLSQQVASAYPYKMKFEDMDGPAVIFRGGTDELMFVTSTADTSFGGFKWIKYVYRDGSLLYKEGLLPDKKLEKKINGDEEVIDQDIDDIRFDYLSGSGEWAESWDYGKELPVAVKVKISYFEPFVINIPMGAKKGKDRDDAA